jgi:nucleoside-diphosphate-sugar epimerase
VKRLLVTGASGFVGRQAIAHLCGRGVEVHAAADRTLEGEVSGPVWHEVDLHDGSAVDRLMAAIRPDGLLHGAWYAVHGRFWNSLENVRWVESSLRLFRAFAACGGRRIVGVGSCAEYDWSTGNCAEDAPLKPHTLYGCCKASLGAMLLAWAKEAGLSAAWGRLFLLYGPHEDPRRFVPSVIQSLLRGEPTSCTSGVQARDLLHVEDAGRALAELLLSKAEGPANIASGTAVPLKDVAGFLGSELGRPDLVRLGALANRPDDPPRLCGAPTRLTQEVGWKPSRSLEDGLRDTIAWWRAGPTA